MIAEDRTNCAESSSMRRIQLNPQATKNKKENRREKKVVALLAFDKTGQKNERNNVGGGWALENGTRRVESMDDPRSERIRKEKASKLL